MGPDLKGFFGKPGASPDNFSARQRHKRMRRLAHLLGERRELHVLDLGGTAEFWEANARHLEPGTLATVDIVNLEPDRFVEGMPLEGGGVLSSRMGDCTAPSGLERPVYDLVFSNSVIEHVGNLRAQKKMADAVRDLGKWHFVQTPSRRFPIEVHFHVPFFAFLPLGIRTFIHRRHDCGFMGREQDWLRARIACEQIRLLGRAEFAALFPRSRILTERVAGFVKSWIATDLPLDGRDRERSEKGD